MNKPRQRLQFEITKKLSVCLHELRLRLSADENLGEEK